MLLCPVIGDSAVASSYAALRHGPGDPATVDLQQRSDEGRSQGSVWWGERRVKLQATLCCAAAETRRAPCNSGTRRFLTGRWEKKKHNAKKIEKQNPGIKASEPRPLSVILSAEVIRENAQNLQSSGLSQQKGGDKEVDSLLSLRLPRPALPTS